MKFIEILNRIAGFSCPIFGVSWNPKESERSIAKKIIIYLEGKRVLYVPSEMEVPRQCIDSVIEIRNFLTSEMTNLDKESNLYSYVSAMRRACNKFLSKCDERKKDIIIYGGEWGHWASWTFASALGEMRGTFGSMIVQVSSAYGLDVESELATIIPE